MYIRSLANSLDQTFKQGSTFYVRLGISQVSLLISFYYNLIWRSWKLIFECFRSFNSTSILNWTCENACLESWARVNKSKKHHGQNVGVMTITFINLF